MGDENHNKYKDMYLIHECEGPIICMKLGDFNHNYVLDSAENKKRHAKRVAKRARVLELIEQSTHSRYYDDMEVDEEWLEEYKDEIAKAKEVAQFENITPAERRKIEERMVAYTFRHNDKQWHQSGSDNHYIRDKIEPKVKDLMKTQRTTYYGTAADDDKLMVACGMIHPYAPRVHEVYKDIPRYRTGDDDRVFFFDTPAVRFGNNKFTQPTTTTKDDGTVYHNTNFDWDTPQIIRVSQSNVKHISMNPNVKHIDEFFLQLTPNGGYTMDEYAIKWYTADKMKGMVQKTYLYCLKDINLDLFEKYKAVYNAADVDVQTSQWMKNTDIFPMVEKIVEMHNFCKDNDDAAAIQQKSRELFVLDVPEAIGQDQELMDKFDELQEWSEGVHTLLDCIDEVSYSPNKDEDLDQDLIKEIKVYLDAKGRLDW
jgi:endonuclease I